MKRSNEISLWMSLQIKRWLAPPVFPGDEQKTRRASLLDMALLITIALTLIILVGNLLGGRTPIATMRADSVAVALCLVLRYWAHHGQVRWASIVLIAVFLVGVTISNAILGTIRTPTSAFYLLIVIGAGLLFDSSGILVTTLLSSLAILGLIWAENAGWLPHPDYTVTITQWITYTAFFGFAGGFTWMALQSTRQALQRADDEIAERKRAQGELQNTRDVLQQAQLFSNEIISGAGEGIAVYDQEFRYLVWNRFMENMTGIPASDVLGRMAFDIFPHLREQGIDHLLERALAGEIAYSHDTPYSVAQTGKSGWVTGTYAPHRDANGRIVGVVGTIHDISERKQVEEALQKSEQYARSIIDSSLDMIITTDNERRIVEFNRAAQETFGYTREEVMGKHINLLYADPVEGQAVHQVTFELGKNSQEVLNKRKNGEIFTSQVSAATMRDSRNIPLGIVGVSRDITERKHNEEALRRAEEKYRTIFDHAVEGIFQSTPAGHFIEANSALARMWGYASPQELISQVTDIPQQVYADPGRRADFRRQMDEAGEVQGFEFQARRKDGSLMWVSNNARAVRNAQGELLYYEGTTQDITARKQAEEALRDSEERYRELVENANDIVFTLDLASNFTSVNPAVERITGYTCEQALTLNLAQVVSPDDFALSRQMLQRKIADGHPTTYLLEVYAKDGRRVSLELSTRLLYREGKIVGSQGIARDITERKRAEEALRESEERFSGAFEHAAVGMALVSPDGHWLRVNRSVCELTGYSQSELLSKTFQDITHPDDLETDLAYVRQMLAGEIRTYQMEKRYLHKLGHVVWILLSVSLVRAARGEPLHFIAQIQDISARKRAEESLQRRADEFAALYDNTHDIGTQLDLAELLQTIVNRSAALFNAPSAFVYLYDPVQHNMELRLIRGSNVPLGTRLEMGEGMAGRVAQSKQPLIIDDYQTWEYRSSKYEGIPFRAILEVPMLYRGEFIGVVAVTEIGSSTRKFTETDMRLLSLFAGQAASAIYNAHLIEETRQRSQRQEAVYRISMSLTHLRGASELCETVVQACSELLSYPFSGIFLLDPVTGDRVLQAHRGWDQAPRDWRLHPGEGVSDAAIVSGELRYWPDTAREPNYVPGKHGYHSELDIPIKVSDSVLGVLIVEDLRVDAFDQGDFDVLRAVANQLAVALENVRLYSNLQQLAMTDSLTGLFNRRHFMELAQREFLRAQRQQVPYAVLMIDLDNFKRINDTFGHSGGDEALRRVAQALFSQVRAVDVIARYGGDEFAILLPNCRLSDARQVVNRLQERSKTLEISHGGERISLSYSVGVAIATLTPEETLDGLLTRADEDMYQMKQQHKGTERAH